MRKLAGHLHSELEHCTLGVCLVGAFVPMHGNIGSMHVGVYCDHAG